MEEAAWSSQTIAFGPLAGLAIAGGLALCSIPLAAMPAVMLLAIAAVSLLRAGEVTADSVPVLGVARVVATCAVIAILRGGLQRRQVEISPLALLALLAYLGQMLSSLMTATYRGEADVELLGALVRHVMYASAFAIGLLAANDDQRRGRTFVWIGWVTIAAAAASSVYWLWTRGHLWPGRSLSALFEHIRSTTLFAATRSLVPFVDEGPNLSALVFTALLALSLPVLMGSRSRARRTLGVAMLVMTVIAVLATESRTGIVVLASSQAVVALLAAASSSRRAAAAAIGCSAVLVVAIGYAFADDRVDWFESQSWLARIDLWSQAAALIEAAPLAGYGFQYSARGNLIERFQDPWTGRIMSRAQSVHSDYLGGLLDGGVIGFSLLVVFLALVLAQVSRLLSYGGHHRRRGLGLLGVACVLVVSMAVGSSLQSPLVSTILWLSLGLAAEDDEPRALALATADEVGEGIAHCRGAEHVDPQMQTSGGG